MNVRTVQHSMLKCAAMTYGGTAPAGTGSWRNIFRPPTQPQWNPMGQVPGAVRRWFDSVGKPQGQSGSYFGGSWQNNPVRNIQGDNQSWRRGFQSPVTSVRDIQADNQTWQRKPWLRQQPSIRDMQADNQTWQRRPWANNINTTALFRKQAGLFGNTMVGRWITDTMGPHTFVSDALGASPLDMIDYQAQKELGWHKPTGGSPNDTYGQEYARAQQRLDEGLAKAQQRQAEARQKQLAQQQAQASRNNERLMADYMAGNNQQLAKQNQRAAQGRAITNKQLTDARGMAQLKVDATRRNIAGMQQEFDRQDAVNRNVQGMARAFMQSGQAPFVQPSQRTPQQVAMDTKYKELYGGTRPA